MVAGGMKIIKYLMFIFNFIFFICGVALIVVGALVKANLKDYLKLLTKSFASPPILFIALGVIITLIAFLGCCGAIKESYCMTMTFSVILALILICELGGGIAAYVYRKEIDGLLKKNTEEVIRDYYKKESDDRKASIDNIQKAVHCCGYNNFTDWNGHAPPSCCIKDLDNKNCTNVPLNIYKIGCKNAMIKKVKENATLIGGIGIAFAVIQILGVIFACVLAKTIKSEGQYA